MIDLVCVFCELDLFRPSGGTREHLEKEEFFLEDTKNTPPQEGRAWRRYAGDPRENALPRELGAFLSVCKTEREAARFLEAALKDAGSSSVEQGKTLRPGDLVHLVWKNRAVAAARIGTTPLAQGFRLVGAHIDAPRVDVKPHPLYEDCGLAMIDGHYYGGVKKYQWTNVPLALHGEIHLAGGVAKTVVVGEDPSDPVLVIPDLAPHLDRETDKRTAKETILGENLDAGDLSAKDTRVALLARDLSHRPLGSHLGEGGGGAAGSVGHFIGVLVGDGHERVEFPCRLDEFRHQADPKPVIGNNRPAQPLLPDFLFEGLQLLLRKAGRPNDDVEAVFQILTHVPLKDRRR